MTNWRPTAYAAGAILVGLLWLSWCHDPQIRRSVRLQDAGRVTDSTAAVTDRRIATLAAREVERESTLARTGRALEQSRRDVSRLRAQIPGAQPDTTGGTGRVGLRTDTPSPSGCAGAPAACDTMIVGLRQIVVGQDSSIGLYQAMLAARDTVMLRLIAERAAYRMERDSWQKVAQPGILTQVGRALPYLAAGYLLAKVTH